MILYLSTLFLIDVLAGIFTQAEPLVGSNVMKVKRNQRPYVVSIVHIKRHRFYQKDTHFCTGVLITHKFILTAAHCLIDESLNETQFIMGSNDRRKGKRYDASMWITYDQWALSQNITKGMTVDDIAIVKLSREVKSRYATPALLSFKKNEKLRDENVILVGWSKDDTENVSNSLREAEARVLSNAVCQDHLKDAFNATKDFPNEYICTEGGTFVLLGNGDSGGPVLKENAVLAISRSVCPRAGFCDIPADVIREHQFNIHTILDPYKDFIADVVTKHS